MIFLSIDPAVTWEGTAWCCYDTLSGDIKTGYSPPRCPVDVLIIEKPQVRRGNHGRASNEVVDLAVQVGRCEEGIPHRTGCVMVTPVAWKGSVPKKIHHQREIPKLPPRWVAALPSGYAAALACKSKSAPTGHDRVDALLLMRYYVCQRFPETM